MAEGWHTYWRNPGDSGLATMIDWSLVPGMAVGPIQWPTPERQPYGTLMNFGYSDEVTLLARLSIADDSPTGNANAFSARDMARLRRYLHSGRRIIFDSDHR